MYSQSREFRGKFPDNRVERVITAEFYLPKQTDNIGEGIKVSPQLIQEHSNPPSVTSCDTSPKFPKPLLGNQIPFSIRLGKGDSAWTFETDRVWFQRHYNRHTLVKGSIHFRSKYFGNWEPFEYLKYFAIEGRAPHFFGGPILALPIFSPEFLGNILLMTTLEMTLKIECIPVGDDDEEEIVLSKQRAEMNNKLLPIPEKSDISLKVGNAGFFVHMKHIKSFSAVSEILSKYVDECVWDWSDIMTQESTCALLRFIYYNEVDTINNPEVAFHLLRFSHMYEHPTLFKVCEKKLTNFRDAQYKLPYVLDMYMYFRISVGFLKLKTHFCGILARNTKKYDVTELKALAQSYGSGQGVKALVEILQFEEPKPEEPPQRKRLEMREVFRKTY